MIGKCLINNRCLANQLNCFSYHKNFRYFAEDGSRKAAISKSNSLSYSTKFIHFQIFNYHLWKKNYLVLGFCRKNKQIKIMKQNLLNSKMNWNACVGSLFYSKMESLSQTLFFSLLQYHCILTPWSDLEIQTFRFFV